FYLEVMDADSNLCSDSIYVVLSSYITLPGNKVANINQGDSVKLFTSVHGGIGNKSYVWSPGEYVDDSTKVDAWAKPSKTTKFMMEVSDSVNCKEVDYFNIYVNPAAIKEIKTGNSIGLYPNPVVAGNRVTIDGLYTNSAVIE